MGDSFVTLCKIKATRNSPSFLRERGSIKWIYMFRAVSPQCCRFFPFFHVGKYAFQKLFFLPCIFFTWCTLKRNRKDETPPSAHLEERTGKKKDKRGCRKKRSFSPLPSLFLSPSSAPSVSSFPFTPNTHLSIYSGWGDGWG